ncbi:stalk domain-containing protein [Paenibacillus lautus]|uniref:stalk domain-containing protein n=1 Tax=Paenibacillus lautus TaxID=1401 RepID=UPI003D2A2981
MKKIGVGFICGAIFFTGISASASNLTAETKDYKLFIDDKEQVLRDKPISIQGKTYLPVREVAEAVGYEFAFKNETIQLSSNRNDEKKEGATSSDRNVKLGKIPITQKLKDVEVTVHAIRLTESTTDFEVTVKNNTDHENITLDLLSTRVEANNNVAGKPSETVGIAPVNPDFGNVTIKPKKEIHGWVSTKGLVKKNIDNIAFQLSLHGKSEKRTFTFHIDCKDMKFRTL